MHLLKVMLKANGKQGVPQGGVISPLLSNLYLTGVDRMLERAKEATRYGKYTGVEYARFADDLVILIDARPRHDCLMAAESKWCRAGPGAAAAFILFAKGNRKMTAAHGTLIGIARFHRVTRLSALSQVRTFCLRNRKNILRGTAKPTCPTGCTRDRLICRPAERPLSSPVAPPLRAQETSSRAAASPSVIGRSRRSRRAVPWSRKCPPRDSPARAPWTRRPSPFFALLDDQLDDFPCAAFRVAHVTRTQRLSSDRSRRLGHMPKKVGLVDASFLTLAWR